MKLIAITPETGFAQEPDFIIRILENGFDYVHLRKPSYTKKEMEDALNRIPEQFYPQLKLHSHFEIAKERCLGGIHLNSRCPMIPAAYTGKISKSCHQLCELTDTGTFEYVFLSPIFDSICKPGYHARFSEERIFKAASDGTINKKTIALGGITAEKITWLQKAGFGGAAFLGYLFSSNSLNELDKKLLLITNQLTT